MQLSTIYNMHKAFSLESIHHVKHFNFPDFRLYELLLRILSPRSISLASIVISILADRQRQTDPITVKSARRKCVMRVVEMVDISQSSKLIKTTRLAGHPSCGCRGGSLPIFGNPFSTLTHEVGNILFRQTLNKGGNLHIQPGWPAFDRHCA